MRMQMIQGTCERCKRERLVFPSRSIRAGICKSCCVQSTQNKQLHYEHTKAWREKNRDYWKNYYAQRAEKLKQYGRDYWMKMKQNPEWMEARRKKLLEYYHKRKELKNAG